MSVPKLRFADSLLFAETLRDRYQYAFGVVIFHGFSGIDDREN
jgi:hypothetical protein